MPDKSTPDPKDTALYIKMSQVEKATIQANAQRQGISVSQHLRDSAMKSK